MKKKFEKIVYEKVFQKNSLESLKIFLFIKYFKLFYFFFSFLKIFEIKVILFFTFSFHDSK